MKGGMWKGLLLALTLGLGTSAHAVLLGYEFTGIAGVGSALNLGGPNINVSGAVFTISGSTTSDTDLSGSPAVGLYAATSVFDFGVLGSFTADAVSTDFYLQNCGAPGIAVNCAGLLDGLAGSFLVVFPPVAGNANAGGIPLGTNIVPASVVANNPFVLTNSSGDILNLSIETIRQFSVTADTGSVDVSAPGSLMLMALGMVGLVRVARRKSA